MEDNLHHINEPKAFLTKEAFDEMLSSQKTQRRELDRTFAVQSEPICEQSQDQSELEIATCPAVPTPEYDHAIQAVLTILLVAAVGYYAVELFAF